ncbi:imidazole glycerol phosphate synthase subunit HisH [Moraxella macacae 0408225]|uniref:Imidazole glycerol phosphate synthase subunit HisH n=1 Tax=Moraxella macacae 0408225 TaxID=1230338 RepID=L2F8S6_9GAMM|nr:imidazole glycerol phosphate synthase subunit HisH [Moraxella macacae]ELA09469.1 imidazole glycerol phosphate synthase subunit HisH [Moraxella macacae 0408225]
MTKIALLDYGMGNLHSAGKALTNVGADVIITQNPKQIQTCDKIVFPGVGAMKDCMAGMTKFGIDDVVKQAVFNKPIMAICVGMQALFEQSEENGGVACLKILPGHVNKFDTNLLQQNPELKIPHMGWNTIHGIDRSHPLWQGIAQNTHFYFVHSFYCIPKDPTILAARCEYGLDFCASVIKDNLFAVQFHPEKSHTAGLQLLKNFVDWQI